MYARIVSRSRYLYLVINGYDVNEVKLVGKEDLELFKKLYADYERASKMLGAKPLSLEDALRELQGLAIVVRGRSREGAKARIRLPKEFDRYITGIYVCEPVFAGYDEFGREIVFYAIKPFTPFRIVEFLTKIKVLDREKLSVVLEELMPMEEEREKVLNLIDLALWIAEEWGSAKLVLESVPGLPKEAIPLTIYVGKNVLGTLVTWRHCLVADLADIHALVEASVVTTRTTPRGIESIGIATLNRKRKIFATWISNPEQIFVVAEEIP